MKKISIIILMLLSLNLLAQNNEQERMFLNAFKALPDSLFEENLEKLTKSEGIIYIEKCLQGKSEFTNNCKSVGVSCIDRKNLFFKILNVRTDNAIRFEYKIFNSENRNIVGFTIIEENHLTDESLVIAFYEYKNNNLMEISSNIFESFNFKTDNYKDSTINKLNFIYESDFFKNAMNDQLTYMFTYSDTIIIMDNLALYHEIDFHEGYIYKYIMDNGKLRLAE